MGLDFTGVFANLLPLLRGAAITLLVILASVAVGGTAALIASFLTEGSSRSVQARALRAAAGLYVSVFRGTPLLTQLILIFYVVPSLVGFDAPPLAAAILGLTLNTAAFQYEIYRASLNTLPKGQVEAAKMLGIGSWAMRFRILMPQMLRISLPALLNEIVIILKNSSLISVIAVTELMRTAQQVAAVTFRPAEIYLSVAAVYLALALCITYAGRRLETAMHRRERG